MPSFATFDAHIAVNGTRLDEFDVSNDIDASGIPRVTCWVPSEAGKTFSVSYKDSKIYPRSASRYLISVDGTRVADKILPADHGPFKLQGPPVDTLTDIRVPGGRRELMFEDLQLTDDDDALRATVSAELGEIHLCVMPVEVLARTDSRSRSTVPEVTLAEGRVHERSKKAGVHSVRLGSLIKYAPRGGLKTRSAGPPIVTFVFRYRPLSLLQAQGIAPPPPPSSNHHSPTPEHVRDAGVKDEEDVNEDEEVRELQAQLDALKKRKRAAGGSRVKTEPAPQRRRLSENSEVIDLTSD